MLFINISFVCNTELYYIYYECTKIYHSSLDGHLEGTEFLAIVNHAVMNFCICTSLCGYIFSLFLGKYLEVELFSHVSSICLFVRYCCIAFQNVCIFYIPTSYVCEFKLLQVLTTPLFSPFFFSTPL